MKKHMCLIITIIVIALILCIPVPEGPYDDGGTYSYNALLYKVVVWNKHTIILDESGKSSTAIPHGTVSVYLFPYNLKSIDNLFKMELASK